MFNAFEELFAPGRRHTRDEQNRLELTREDVGDSDPGRGPIDLSSGKAVIRLPEPPPAEAAPDPGRDSERPEGGAGEQSAARWSREQRNGGGAVS